MYNTECYMHDNILFIKHICNLYCNMYTEVSTFFNPYFVIMCGYCLVLDTPVQYAAFSSYIFVLIFIDLWRFQAQYLDHIKNPSPPITSQYPPAFISCFYKTYWVLYVFPRPVLNLLSCTIWHHIPRCATKQCSPTSHNNQEYAPQTWREDSTVDAIPQFISTLHSCAKLSVKAIQISWLLVQLDTGALHY